MDKVGACEYLILKECVIGKKCYFFGTFCVRTLWMALARSTAINNKQTKKIGVQMKLK